jgi:hypothetical protein
VVGYHEKYSVVGIAIYGPQCHSAAYSIMMLKQVPGEGILLDKGWRFKAGDDLQWARPGLNVNDWQPIDPH